MYDMPLEAEGDREREENKIICHLAVTGERQKNT